MHPFIHLLLTVGLFLILKLYISLGYSVLFVSLLLTVLIDIAEHSNIFFMKPANKLVKEVRRRFSEEGLFSAYKYYYHNRIGSFAFANFHNLLFMCITLLAAIVLKSYAVFIGLTFHLVCDMLNEYAKTGTFEFWTLGSARMLKHHLNRLLK